MRLLADVMTTDMKTVRTDDVIGPVRDLILDGSIHAVPVLGNDGHLAGIITSADLVEEWSPGMGVATVMSDEVTTATKDVTIADAARTMLDQRVHHLVVVDGDDVIGIVSSFDLLRALADTAEAAQSRTLPPKIEAGPGDVIVIRGHSIGRRERRGIITETRGENGGPPFVVRWLDDPHAEPHDVVFFPGSDADIEHPDDASA